MCVCGVFTMWCVYMCVCVGGLFCVIYNSTMQTVSDHNFLCVGVCTCVCGDQTPAPSKEIGNNPDKNPCAHVRRGDPLRLLYHNVRANLSIPAMEMNTDDDFVFHVVSPFLPLLRSFVLSSLLILHLSTTSLSLCWGKWDEKASELSGNWHGVLAPLSTQQKREMLLCQEERGEKGGR